MVPRPLLLLSLCLAGAAAPLEAAADEPRPGVIRTAGKRAVQLYRELQRPGTGRIKPGVLARVKGVLFKEFPVLAERQVQLSKRLRQENTDPTFRGAHPMFRRLVHEGWYSRGLEIDGIQRQADMLRKTRALSRDVPLSEVEFLALDLEMTGGGRTTGRYDRGKRRFFSGAKELTQIGYTIYRKGKAAESGSIFIRPDGAIDPKVQKFNGITPERLAGEPHLERVAGQLLTLMKGKVLIGQGIQRRDWVWLKSNFARLGVDLPGPRGLVLDTHLMSHNIDPKGMGLKALAKRFGTTLDNHHDAKFDARAVGDLFFTMAKRMGITTLGQAQDYQTLGYQAMRAPKK